MVGPPVKRGRPTSLTPEVHRRIVKALRDGNTRANSCKLGDVSNDTFLQWLKRGRNGEQPFSEFAEACDRAEAECEDEALRDIAAAGKDPKTWQARAWWLERRKPADWGRKDKLELQASAQPVQLDDPRFWEQLRATLAEHDRLLAAEPKQLGAGGEHVPEAEIVPEGEDE